MSRKDVNGPDFVPQPWRDVWEDYEILHGNLSEKTLANYRDTVVQLAKFANGSAPTPEALDRRLALALPQVR